jgi:hypothetical protein
MYFNSFSKIYYDFPTKENQDNTLHILTDITSNVRIRKEVLENITIYDEYDMLDGETPEMVAEKVYGNPEYHWIIMLVNQRYDYIQDFPITNDELMQLTVDVYGQNRIYDVHHYEKNGIIVEGVATMKVPAATHALIKENDFIYTANANARVETISYEFIVSDSLYTSKFQSYSNVKVYDAPLSTRTINNYIGTARIYSLKDNTTILGGLNLSPGKSGSDIRSIYTESNEFQCNAILNTASQPVLGVLVDYGKFSAGESAIVRGFRINTFGSNELAPFANYYIPQNGGFELNENYTAITNYEYEIRSNEAKRRIKIISPTLITQIINEFKELMST